MFAGFSPASNDISWYHVGQVIFDTGKQWASQKSAVVEISDEAVHGHSAVKHVFSCELSVPIQQYIQSYHSPQFLFENIDDMKSPMVRDIPSQSYIARPGCTAVFCGWVCHQATLA
eukprot:s1427_g18.t1